MENLNLVAFNLPSYSDYLNIIFRFLINFIAIYIISKKLYFKIRKNRDYLFSLFLINVIVFFVCYILNSVEVSMGFAFGIFAIFSILRYRTITIPIKEMTYMFIAISIGVINAISNSYISIIITILINLTIITLAIILEKIWVKNEISKYVIYEKIENIKPENHKILIQDLKERTGLEIHRFVISEINFLRDVARIKVFYYNSNDFEDTTLND